jgi:hypothetical protein
VLAFARRALKAHDRIIMSLPLGWLPKPPLWALWVMQAALWAGLALTLWMQFRIGL